MPSVGSIRHRYYDGLGDQGKGVLPALLIVRDSPLIPLLECADCEYGQCRSARAELCQGQGRAALLIAGRVISVWCRRLMISLLHSELS